MYRLLIVYACALIASIAAQDFACSEAEVSQYLDCAFEPRDGPDQALQNDINDCFTAQGCSSPDFEAENDRDGGIRELIRQKIDELPQENQDCIEEKLDERRERGGKSGGGKIAKLEECLGRPLPEPVATAMQAQMETKRAEKQASGGKGRHGKGGMHHMKKVLMKATRECAQNGGDAETLGKCVIDAKAARKAGKCEERQQCANSLPAACQASIVDLQSDLCQCASDAREEGGFKGKGGRSGRGGKSRFGRKMMNIIEECVSDPATVDEIKEAAREQRRELANEKLAECQEQIREKRQSGRRGGKRRGGGGDGQDSELRDAFKSCMERRLSPLGIQKPERGSDRSQIDEATRQAIHDAKDACAAETGYEPRRRVGSRGGGDPVQREAFRDCMEQGLAARGLQKPERGPNGERPEISDADRAIIEEVKDSCSQQTGFEGRGRGGGRSGNNGQGGNGGNYGGGNGNNGGNQGNGESSQIRACVAAEIQRRNIDFPEPSGGNNGPILTNAQQEILAEIFESCRAQILRSKRQIGAGGKGNGFGKGNSELRACLRQLRQQRRQDGESDDLGDVMEELKEYAKSKNLRQPHFCPCEKESDDE